MTRTKKAAVAARAAKERGETTVETLPPTSSQDNNEDEDPQNLNMPSSSQDNNDNQDAGNLDVQSRSPDMSTEQDVSQLRPMTSELGELSRPDGSATFSQGDTCVTVAVYGPGEVRMNKEQHDQATVEVIYKGRTGLPGCSDRFNETLLRSTCETVILTALHPRSSISVVVQELQNSGSFLACCVNAACLALLDASVSTKYLIAAVACVVDANGTIGLDPTAKEEKNAMAALTFVFDSKDQGVITVATSGSYSTEQFQSCLSACSAASKSVFQFYRDSMERKLSKAV